MTQLKNDEFNGVFYKPEVTGAKVVSGLVQFYNSHLVESMSSLYGRERYFTTVAILSSSATFEVVQKAIQASYENESYRLRKTDKTPIYANELPTPLKRGVTERPNDPRFADCVLLTVSSRDKPEIVDAYGKKFNGNEVKNGALGRISFVFSPYYIAEDDRKGYSVRLHNVQILDNAFEEDFTEKRSASADFGKHYISKKDKPADEEEDLGEILKELE